MTVSIKNDRERYRRETDFDGSLLLQFVTLHCGRIQVLTPRNIGVIRIIGRLDPRLVQATANKSPEAEFPGSRAAPTATSLSVLGSLHFLILFPLLPAFLPWPSGILPRCLLGCGVHFALLLSFPLLRDGFPFSGSVRAIGHHHGLGFQDLQEFCVLVLRVIESRIEADTGFRRRSRDFFFSPILERLRGCSRRRAEETLWAAREERTDDEQPERWSWCAVNSNLGESLPKGSAGSGGGGGGAGGSLCGVTNCSGKRSSSRWLAARSSDRMSKISRSVVDATPDQDKARKSTSREASIPKHTRTWREKLTPASGNRCVGGRFLKQLVLESQFTLVFCAEELRCERPAVLDEPTVQMQPLVPHEALLGPGIRGKRKRKKT